MNGIQFLLLAFCLTLIKVINALLAGVSIGYSSPEKDMKKPPCEGRPTGIGNL